MKSAKRTYRADLTHRNELSSPGLGTSTICVFFHRLLPIVLAVLPASLVASKDVPSWVGEVASRATPVYPGKVPAAVLFDERRVVVDPSGTMTAITRHAVKILTRDGRREAEGVEHYTKGGRQVKQLHAWLVAPNGSIKTFAKSSVEDLGSFTAMELYDDIRFRRVSADNPELGAVFLYEFQVEEKALFAQDEYDFQTDLPSVQARYVLTLPPGWNATAVVLNHEPLQAVRDGSTYTWELRDLPFREREQQAPDMRGSTPRLAVNFKPASVTSSVAFSSWTDVSQWHTSLAAGQDEVTPEISAKVAQLTGNAKTEYDTIRAIGHYVQTLRYVAIEMDLAHGGGYRPHSAEMVLRKQYGDCKDKANLMRALLKAAGLQSFLVSIYSGDRTFVREEWPSPHQFNHMIVAVRVSDVTNVPTVISSSLGRLLLFDPTDETTPMGDLPWYEQDSWALICAGDQGKLLKMPSTAPEANITDQTIQASLTGNGELTASVSTATQGQAAHDERARHASNNPELYKYLMQLQVNHKANGASISKLETEDSFEQNRFNLKIEFTSRLYGQLMQRRLLVFSPSVVRPDAPEFTENEQRTQRVILRASVYRKKVRLKLPAGFTVDEIPSPFKADSGFAKFTLAYRQEPGELIMEEEMRTEGVTLPASQYARVKKFFDDLLGADSQNAVLVKN